MEEYAVPTLPSRDLHETVAFYERLGFHNAGDPPEVWDYAIIRRGTIEVHFYKDVDVDPSTTSAGCFIWVQDVDALYAEWTGSGTAPDSRPDRLTAPADTAYGVRALGLIDPSGNHVRFGTGPH
jgi:catechol 2,3-dioxygenase-like lactoylglutathione lyase family enzyme